MDIINLFIAKDPSPILKQHKSLFGNINAIENREIADFDEIDQTINNPNPPTHIILCNVREYREHELLAERQLKELYPKSEIMVSTTFLDKNTMLQAILNMMKKAEQRPLEVVEHKSDKKSSLTARELECLQIIAKGLSNQEAASVLQLSIATIRTHLEHIYQKLDVSNRVEAITEGIRQGIIQI